ncbi:MAG: DegV family protein [Clostridia bacterium]|nr:DegV family protein [Clostridia bacterium]
MDKYVILPDVTCDLSREIRSEFGLTDYVKGHVSISDGRELISELEWNNISMKEFYATVGDKRMKVSTSPANTDEYYKIFEEYVNKGVAILSMSLSSAISATYNFADMAAKRIRENYPNARIYCFDSFRMSGAYGLLVMHALEKKNEGMGFDELCQWLENNKRRVHQMGPIDDLIIVARRGRISMGKAIMGSFAGVKPMGDCNADGYTTAIGKAKGIKKALAATAEYVKETIVDPESQFILISHTDREEYAMMLKELVEKAVPARKVYVSDVYPGSGTNIGPGMIGCYYLGSEITDLAAEKEILTKVLGK